MASGSVPQFATGVQFDTSGNAPSTLVLRDNNSAINGNVITGTALVTTGSFTGAVVSTTTALVLGTALTYLGNTTGGSFTVTVPPASTCQGRMYHVKNSGTTNTLSIKGTETIDSTTVQNLTTMQSTRLTSDGSVWFTV
jgi:hypothetical protein